MQWLPQLNVDSGGCNSYHDIDVCSGFGNSDTDHHGINDDCNENNNNDNNNNLVIINVYSQ